MPAETGVTVVVPTLNRGAVLLDCLRDLLVQDHRPLEILVVDQSDALDPELGALAQQEPELISLHKVDFRGLPAARNYGWRQARYDAVVFVDDDIRCGVALVREHLRTLQMPGVGVVAGGVIELKSKPGAETSRVGYFNRWTGLPERGFAASGEFEVDHAPGGNFSAWRKVLLPACQAERKPGVFQRSSTADAPCGSIRRMQGARYAALYFWFDS